MRVVFGGGVRDITNMAHLNMCLRGREQNKAESNDKAGKLPSLA